MKAINDHPLDRALADMPADIVPPRNLWPEISGRIDRAIFR